MSIIGSVIAPIERSIVEPTDTADPWDGRPAPDASPQNLTAPSISGSVAVGNTLALTPGTWTAPPSAEAASVSYTLRRGGVPVAGVTDVSESTFESYVLVGADVGPQLVCREADSVGGAFADSNALSG